MITSHKTRVCFNSFSDWKRISEPKVSHCSAALCAHYINIPSVNLGCTSTTLLLQNEETSYLIGCSCTILCRFVDARQTFQWSFQSSHVNINKETLLNVCKKAICSMLYVLALHVENIMRVGSKCSAFSRSAFSR